jgi:hypothetical protein
MQTPDETHPFHDPRPSRAGLRNWVQLALCARMTSSASAAGLFYDPSWEIL